MIPIRNDIWSSLISNIEVFPEADTCVLCRCDVPHSRSEHDEVLANGGKLRCSAARPELNATQPEYWDRRRALDRQRREEIKQRRMLKVKS